MTFIRLVQFQKLRTKMSLDVSMATALPSKEKSSLSKLASLDK